jgi:hypothetical protein
VVTTLGIDPPPRQAGGPGGADEVGGEHRQHRRPGDAGDRGQIALPGLTLAIFALAPIARITRAAMLAVLAADLPAAATGRRPGRCGRSRRRAPPASPPG